MQVSGCRGDACVAPTSDRRCGKRVCRAPPPASLPSQTHKEIRLIRFLRTSVSLGGSAPKPPACIAFGQWHENTLACSSLGTGLAGRPAPRRRRIGPDPKRDVLLPGARSVGKHREPCGRPVAGAMPSFAAVLSCSCHAAGGKRNMPGVRGQRPRSSSAVHPKVPEDRMSPLLSFRAKPRNLPSAGRLPPAWHMNTCATPTALGTARVSAVRARLRPTGGCVLFLARPLGFARGDKRGASGLRPE